MQVGMIGLGRMGANMVRRLIGGGHECVVFDRSQQAVDALEELALAIDPRGRLPLAISGSIGERLAPRMRPFVRSRLVPAQAGAAGYIASKRALIAFVESLAIEYRDHGVRANAILPSVIDTPGNRASQPDADHSKWVAPSEIAVVIAFLCSEHSAPTSGAAIPVYGRA